MNKHANFFENVVNQPEKHFFLACSGGVDSMVLLFLLQKVTQNITVLHVNYQLRGQDSTDDQTFILAHCKAQQIKVETITVNTPELLSNGGNLQEIARNIRYEWFQTFLGASKNNVLVLAHHRDDQMETFFQHIARKSGILGMACMLPSHGQIIRPLLAYSKAEIVHFAQTKGIQWREDVSNEKSTYTRNKLRNVFLPSVLNEMPSLPSSVETLVAAFQDTQAGLEIAASTLAVWIHEHQRLSFEAWDNSSEEVRVALLGQLNIRPTFIAELNKLRNAQKGKFTAIDQWIISVGKQQFHVEKTLNVPTFSIHTEEVDQLPSSFNTYEIYIDADKIIGNLQLRVWETGDRIEPIGMNGSQLVSKILKDNNVSFQAKKQSMVLTDDTSIIWCYPYKISRKFCANSNSKKLLKITLKHM